MRSNFKTSERAPVLLTYKRPLVKISSIGKDIRCQSLSVFYPLLPRICTLMDEDVVDGNWNNDIFSTLCWAPKQLRSHSTAHQHVGQPFRKLFQSVSYFTAGSNTENGCSIGSSSTISSAIKVHRGGEKTAKLWHRISFSVMNIFIFCQKGVKSTGVLSLVLNFEHIWRTSENPVSVPM